MSRKNFEIVDMPSETLTYTLYTPFYVGLIYKILLLINDVNPVYAGLIESKFICSYYQVSASETING